MGADGAERTEFPGGVTQRLSRDGERLIDYGNGQTEVHTRAFKRRSYPDGTTKTIYPDGRQETRYATGRLR